MIILKRQKGSCCSFLYSGDVAAKAFGSVATVEKGKRGGRVWYFTRSFRVLQHTPQRNPLEPWAPAALTGGLHTAYHYFFLLLLLLARHQSLLAVPSTTRPPSSSLYIYIQYIIRDLFVGGSGGSKRDGVWRQVKRQMIFVNLALTSESAMR